MDKEVSVSAFRIQATKVLLQTLHKEYTGRVEHAEKVEKADSALGEEEDFRSFGEDKAEGSGQVAAVATN